MNELPLSVWLDHNGALLRLRLNRPKANIIDAAMIAALREALAAHRGQPGLLAALLDADGPHFSYGASVEEHLPAKCAAMLAALHGLLVEMLEWPAPILVVARGQCLGGGLEVALGGSLIFAGNDAKFGQPEIRLGLFAPAASVLLPGRIGQAAAEEMLVTGRSLDADEAMRAGLAFHVNQDPEAAALTWFDRELAGKSSAALGCALAAVRGDYIATTKRRIDDVERLYMERLMRTHDANEGLDAFLAKRPAQWQHR
ncbi:MAG: cyclohexa-1,5-dienecarbonyl-CoA hydratase [Burkholderiales bacterium]|nr:cyclohexa-1,5-dienecarbonyl-CoA hydratase [Burkholderiales bacterium]